MRKRKGMIFLAKELMRYHLTEKLVGFTAAGQRQRQTYVLKEMRQKNVKSTYASNRLHPHCKPTDLCK
jgi:hypothetical protein